MANLPQGRRRKSYYVLLFQRRLLGSPSISDSSDLAYIVGLTAFGLISRATLKFLPAAT